MSIDPAGATAPFVYVESLTSRRLMRMKALGLITDEELWPDDGGWSFRGHMLGIRPPEFCRRPGWTKGAAVRLADGRRWHLPRIDPALAVTTPGLMAAIRSLLRSYGAHMAQPDDTRLRLGLHQSGDELTRVLVGANYFVCYTYGPGGRPLTDAERAEQHLDSLIRLTTWSEPLAWTTCINALVRAIDRTDAVMSLAIAFDPMLGWADSPN